jgi:hypothetical protein
MCFPPNRLTRKTPTLHLPWRRPRREKGRQEAQTHTGRPEERRRRRNEKEKKKKDKTEKNRKGEQKEKHLP